MDVTLEQMEGRELAVESVDVSRWFGKSAQVWVREVSAKEATDARKGTAELSEAEANDFWFRLCFCDKDGNQVIAAEQPIDNDKIGAGLMAAVVNKAIGLNGFDTEDLEKNSPGQSGDSPSD